MRFLGILAALAAMAGAAVAEPSVEIRHAAARVTIIPEARSDVQVSIARTNPHLPLTVSRFGATTIVDGPLGHRAPSCESVFGRRFVYIWGVGRVPYEALPQVVVRVPLSATVVADGAIYGAVGRGRGLDLSNSGCGDWVLADQEGRVRIHTAGSGDVRGGSNGATDVVATGSSDVRLQAVHGGLSTSISGSGDVESGWVDGPLHANIGGSGDVVVKDGRVGDMDVSVAGSGDVKFGGVAGTLRARVAGSGDVHVAHVTGAVSRVIAGSGDVTWGH